MPLTRNGIDAMLEKRRLRWPGHAADHPTSQPDGGTTTGPWHGLVLIALALLFFAPDFCLAAPSSDDSDRAFATSIVAAINSKELGRRTALLHSKSLPCVRGDNTSIFRDIVARQARRRVPAKFHWGIVPVKKGEAPLFAELFDYPIVPTHRLQLDFDTGPTSSTTLILQIAREGTRWREVVGCPKPGTVAAMQAARQARMKETERARELAERVSPQLRDSVLQLFRAGRRIEAYRKYSVAAHEDLATAKEVVDLLADKARLPR
jgi:hypothetical protein